jgi:anti-anti-sigma factor
VVVTGHGEIDLTTVDTLIDTLDNVLRQERPTHIDVNLADVTFMDSSGINALMTCRAEASRSGCRITVSHPQPVVRRLFAVTGLLPAFGIPED